MLASKRLPWLLAVTALVVVAWATTVGSASSLGTISSTDTLFGCSVVAPVELSTGTSSCP